MRSTWHCGQRWHRRASVCRSSWPPRSRCCRYRHQTSVDYGHCVLKKRRDHRIQQPIHMHIAAVFSVTSRVWQVNGAHNIVMCAFYRGTADQHQNYRAAFHRVKLFCQCRKVKVALRPGPQAARINPLLWGWNNARHHCAKKYGIRQSFAAKLHAPSAICCLRFRRH